jgi:hypothetical protein
LRYVLNRSLGKLMNQNQKMKMKLIAVTQAVQAVIDKSWIPEDLRGNRYFSVEDLWVFIPDWTPTKTQAGPCEECGMFALGIPFIPGNQLRSSFPYLEIEDENTIAANVHPNCRCKLLREGTEQPKDVLSKEEVKRAFVEREI